MTLILIYLFKLSRVKPTTDSSISKPRDKPSRYKIPFMGDWMENEQRKSMELEKHLVTKGYPKTEVCC